jgi:hypothetical protein
MSTFIGGHIGIQMSFADVMCNRHVLRDISELSPRGT